MPISIIGCGAWGMAFSTAVCKKIPVNIWLRNHLKMRSVVDSIQQKKLSEFITVHDNVSMLIKTSNIVMPAVPTESLRSVCKLLKDNGFYNGIIITCCKGIEKETLMLPAEVVKSELPNASAMVISGPSFANEIMLGLPCKVMLAGEDEAIGKAVSSQISSKNFEVIYSKNAIEVQICSALKNIIAIACGITRGLGLGRNSEAIVITKGFNDAVKLCKAMNAKLTTEHELDYACFGDFVMTCNAHESRNMTFGVSIGKNNKLHNKKPNQTIEGVSSSSSVQSLANKLGINLPVCSTVYKIIHENANIIDSIMDTIHST